MLYYLGICLMLWLIVGLIYGILITWVDDGLWDELQAIMKLDEPLEDETSQHLYELVMKNRVNYNVFCMITGPIMPYQDIKNWIKFKLNK